LIEKEQSIERFDYFGLVKLNQLILTKLLQESTQQKKLFLIKINFLNIYGKRLDLSGRFFLFYEMINISF
jgi:hypothetical protein